METTVSHVHSNVRKTKVVKVGSDRYFQSFAVCLDCKLQSDVRLTELKKGPLRDSNH